MSHPAPPVPLLHGAINPDEWRFQQDEPPPEQTRVPRALNETKHAWADFMNDVHNRLHPIFAEEYLPSLDRAPATDPLNDLNLSVSIGLEITQATGELALIYVKRSSGNAEFDAAAVASCLRVFPLPVPTEIASDDGLAYLDWKFWRDKGACSTFSARPHRFARRSDSP